MDHTTQLPTPFTPTRRPALSTLSPIKTADNSFHPRSPTPRRRVRNTEPRSIIHENRENEDIIVAIPLYNIPTSSSSTQTHAHSSSLPPATPISAGNVPRTFVNHSADKGPPRKRRRVVLSVPKTSILSADSNQLPAEFLPTPPSTTSRGRKRKAPAADGVTPPTPTPPSRMPSEVPMSGAHEPLADASAPPRRYTTLASLEFPSTQDRSLPLEIKLYLVVQYGRSLGLPLHEFLYQVFFRPLLTERQKWGDGSLESHCFHARSCIIASFLQGKCTRKPGHLLELWFRHPAGSDDAASPLMFTLDVPYTSIGPVRPAMSSFGAQIIQRELKLQARKAVLPSSGLHVHIPTKKNPFPSHESVVSWDNFGSQTQSAITKIHQEAQSLLWRLLCAVATPDTFITNGRDREYRPIEQVVSTVISKLAFSRSPYARLGPILEGLFNIVSLTSVDKFRYDSRVGNTPSYNTILAALHGLGKQSMVRLKDISHDPGHWWWMIIDNIQNFIRRRMTRIGRTNHMNVGMAGTIWIAPAGAADPSVLDYDDKQRRRAACQRDKITTSELLQLPDDEHERKVFAFQWLWVLGNHVPRLDSLKGRANNKLRTEARRQQLPDARTQCFTLPTVSGSETQLTEFLASVLDFLESAGQTGDRFQKRMIPVGGDGLTFELLIKAMQQRQFHASPFHSLKLLNPMLQWWHLFWTNDARIIDRHMGNPSGSDASSFGHSASAIGRKLSKEQGKYNYNQATDLLYMILDARMLDCWRLYLSRIATREGLDISTCQTAADVVEVLHHSNKMPSSEKFEACAFDLHKLYTTEEAIYRAASGREAKDVPRAQTQHTPSLLTALDASAKGSPISPGDAMLAASKDFMREAIRSRECVWAVAIGDVGRAWEQILNLLFSFAGSSHKKYAQYILEAIFDLEYESSKALREALLSTHVAKVSDLPGASRRPCDLIQEFLQRIIEAIVQHKGAEFGAQFIREAIAPNLGQFQRLKDEFLEGVGLDHHSQRRSKPSSESEMSILQRVYYKADLHSFSKSRPKDNTKDSIFESHYRKGVKVMESGSQKKWATRQMLMRDIQSSHAATSTHPSSFADEDGDEVFLDDLPLWVHDVNQGNITVRELNPTVVAQAVIALMESGGEDGVNEEVIDEASCPVPAAKDGFDTDNDE